MRLISKILLGLCILPMLWSCQGGGDQPSGTRALIHTDFGDMTVLLYDDTPQHRDNFVKLAKEGFFDGTLFHRVIMNFMIQGGDPNSKDPAQKGMWGQGGPGYTIPAEFNPKHLHKKGALAAARQGDNVNPQRKSSGSQFYIVHGQPVNPQTLTQMEAQVKQMVDPAFTYSEEARTEYLRNGGTPFLDMQYTVFGEVISGIEVVDKIASVPTGPGPSPGQADIPLEDIKITVKILD
ncbi:MAG: peptidylprolyl isomerase [Bacteroidia bacterium]|nr:peptidylprolyl isomerase [Bacteroidia bacterium]